MNIRHVLLGALAVPGVLLGATIDRSTLTEVVNNVKVFDPGSKQATPAKVQTEFIAPNVLRTGAASRAEMVAPDQTVTRVGQNTIFSFSRESREIELQKGSILFQSPSGKGGGTIRTSAASAAVLGTTLIVTATKNGGFKVLLVEGKGRVRSADGSVRTLAGGQMVYALPGGKLSGIFEFRLSQQVAASNLVSGFKKKLPSADKIQKAIDKQEKDLASGKALDTGLLASGSPSIAYQIDVARDTLVNEGMQKGEAVQTRFQKAVTTEAVAATTTLDRARVFTEDDVDPIEFPGDSRPFFALSDDASGLPVRATTFAQYFGDNIVFDSPSVSLTEFNGKEAFRFLALNDVLLNDSVNFGQFSGVLQIWAGGTFQTNKSQAVKLEAAAPALALVAFGDQFSPANPLPQTLADLSTKVPLRLTAFTAQNTAGGLALVGGDVDLNGVRLGAETDLLVGAGNNLRISANEGGLAPIALTGEGTPQFPRTSALRAKDSIEVRSGNHTNISGASIQAPQIRVRSNNDLTLTAVQINDTSSIESNPSGPTGPERTRLITKNLADLSRVNFQANDVLVSARTVKLTDVRFRQNSNVVLESQRGLLAPNPNTNQPALPGFVNFIRGVRYGSQPAQNAIITQPSSSAGIVIRQR